MYERLVRVSESAQDCAAIATRGGGETKWEAGDRKDPDLHAEMVRDVTIGRVKSFLDLDDPNSCVAGCGPRGQEILEKYGRTFGDPKFTNPKHLRMMPTALPVMRQLTGYCAKPQCSDGKSTTRSDGENTSQKPVVMQCIDKDGKPKGRCLGDDSLNTEKSCKDSGHAWTVPTTEAQCKVQNQGGDFRNKWYFSCSDGKSTTYADCTRAKHKWTEIPVPKEKTDGECMGNRTLSYAQCKAANLSWRNGPARLSRGAALGAVLGAAAGTAGGAAAGAAVDAPSLGLQKYILTKEQCARHQGQWISPGSVSHVCLGDSTKSETECKGETTLCTMPERDVYTVDKTAPELQKLMGGNFRPNCTNEKLRWVALPNIKHGGLSKNSDEYWDKYTDEEFRRVWLSIADKIGQGFSNGNKLVYKKEDGVCDLTQNFNCTAGQYVSTQQSPSGNIVKCRRCPAGTFEADGSKSVRLPQSSAAYNYHASKYVTNPTLWLDSKVEPSTALFASDDNKDVLIGVVGSVGKTTDGYVRTKLTSPLNAAAVRALNAKATLTATPTRCKPKTITSCPYGQELVVTNATMDNRCQACPDGTFKPPSKQELESYPDHIQADGTWKATNYNGYVNFSRGKGEKRLELQACKPWGSMGRPAAQERENTNKLGKTSDGNDNRVTGEFWRDTPKEPDWLSGRKKRAYSGRTTWRKWNVAQQKFVYPKFHRERVDDRCRSNEYRTAKSHAFCQPNQVASKTTKTGSWYTFEDFTTWNPYARSQNGELLTEAQCTDDKGNWIRVPAAGPTTNTTCRPCRPMPNCATSDTTSCSRIEWDEDEADNNNAAVERSNGKRLYLKCESGKDGYYVNANGTVRACTTSQPNCDDNGTACVGNTPQLQCKTAAEGHYVNTDDGTVKACTAQSGCTT